jgi:hypothetical protein
MTDEAVVLEWQNQTLRFSPQIASVVDRLQAMQVVTLEQLSVGLDRMVVNAFVFTLLATGVLCIAGSGAEFSGEKRSRL